jgi:hypothetical protein
MAKPRRVHLPPQPPSLRGKGERSALQTAPPVDPAEAGALASRVQQQLDSPDAAVTTLAEAPAPLAAAALEALRQGAGPAAIPVLAQAAERADAPLVAHAALVELGAVPEPAAAAALAHLGDTLAAKDLRKEARRALFHLRSQGVVPPAETAVARPAPSVLQPRVTFYQVLASNADGLGSRALALFADRPLGGAYLFNVLLNDLAGMKDFVVRDSTRKKLSAIESEMRQRERQTWIELPLNYARWLIQEALTLNAESGFTVPLEYRAWADTIGAPEQTYERPLAYEEISRFEIKMRPELLEQSPRLFEEPEVQPWFLGYRDVQKYVTEVRRAVESRIVLTAETDEQRLERVLTTAIREVMTAPQRRALQRRLEEQAYMFLRTDRPQQAKLAIAAAVEIADSDPALLSRNPFVRVYVQRSIEIPLRVLRAGADPSAIDRGPLDPVD